MLQSEQREIQDGARNDPVFHLVLTIQPCDERYFVTWQRSRSWRLVLTFPERASVVLFLLMRQFTQNG
jgi:hypothetical protein